MSIITKEDKRFFKENGYIKLEGLISKEKCDRVIADIWAFLERDPHNKADWYNPPRGVLASTGMVEMYQRQSMWDIRQDPSLYQAFSEVLNEEKLWVSVDRVNMTPPKSEAHPELDAGFIHWDADTANLPDPIPHPYGLQGVLYLDDTSEKQGGFQCVPSIYRNFEQWLASQPDDRDPRHPNLDGHDIIPIPGKKGDFVIWDRLLAHGNGSNLADTPRYAMYVTMSAAQPERMDKRQSAVKNWQENVGPERGPFPGDPRRWEQKNSDGPAVLTPLGRKLLGVDPWE